jgi:acyl-CoA dehydrogenase
MDIDRLMPPSAGLPAEAEPLRRAVRAFLDDERAAGRYKPACDSWLSGWDEGFSRELGARGWIGMTIPAEFGGGGRSALERYVVTEELLAAGAPVAAHWIADRQVAPALLRYGSDMLRRRYLPGIAKGEIYFAIGLSEPDAGSDLAAVRTSAVAVPGGWTVSGSKLWTSGAHRAHAFVVLSRTAPATAAARHSGLSQLLIELDQPGVRIRPIISMTGEHHFNEVVLDGVFVPDSMVVGTIGAGWDQVTSELAYERSGPERFLSTFPLLDALLRQLSGGSGPPDEAVAERIGAVVSRLFACRQLSTGVASTLAAGDVPDLAAALVKDIGTQLENDVISAVRSCARLEPDLGADGLDGMLAHAILHSPGFTLRGGTTEILRGVVARGLGLR